MYLSGGMSLKVGCSSTSSIPSGMVVRSSATSEEARGEPSVSDSQVARIPRPKVKPREKWAKGDGPGEYGGPPIDLKIRPSWGGGSKEDPLTSTDDYIWKKVWQPFVETAPADMKPPPPPVAEPDSGFLSLNRAIALDSMDVDLSKELMQPSKATLERQVAAARRASSLELAAQRREENKTRWRFAPTKREEEQWARANKSASGGTEKLMRDVDKKKVDPVKDAAIARARYLKLKQDLQITTVAIGGAGLLGTFFAYSPEVSASYGVGLVGAFAYIRMLGNSVDGLAAQDSSGAMKGAMGQPRILVPVLLVMLFNRWNALAVPQYDVIPLQLIPMLVGFFTYKAATFVETFKELLPKTEENDSDI
ncbi:hypothetical protein KC19_3G213800 [Ceratodon purpureus]|uniref:CGL160/ATPI domain-containing protein n=2 Tax=Ceratodon purpureus TaxID=3225 RepID=A0A8T0INU2_CERPU|nr:hypothetical protein KC19_3G213800 [Ceratodon purpureus]